MRKRAGQVGRYWLDRVPGSANWYAFWYDPGSRRVRRRSLRTEDDSEAHDRLAEIAVKRGRPRQADPADTFVSVILDDYLEGHVAQKPGAKTAAYNAAHILAFFGGDRVSDLTLARQEAYIEKRRGDLAHPPRPGEKTKKPRTRKVSDATIGRELSVLRAALHRARKRGDLRSVPHIMDTPKPPPRQRWLTRDEAARLVDAGGPDHFRLFLILALHTAARPGALLDLRWFQVDLDNATLDLNPPGRRQTAKRRAFLRMSATLHAALVEADRVKRSERVIAYGKRAIKSVRRAFSEACERAGLVGVTPGTLRHTAATWMAQAGVPMWEIAGRLGHTTAKTTELYAKHHPAFQEQSIAALDEAFAPKFLPSPVKEKPMKVRKPARNVVGAAGIEPATPTMSRKRA